MDPARTIVSCTTDLHFSLLFAVSILVNHSVLLPYNLSLVVSQNHLSGICCWVSEHILLSEVSLLASGPTLSLWRTNGSYLLTVGDLTSHLLPHEQCSEGHQRTQTSSLHYNNNMGRDRTFGWPYQNLIAPLT